MSEMRDKMMRQSRQYNGVISRLAPGLASLMRYDRSWFRSDFAAGLSVAAVALPVGIAYAELARVPPEIGIYAAIFPLFAYALFGSSRHLIVGPDAATCILVAASLMPLASGDPQRYLALLVLLTLITGLFHLAGGLLRLGFMASFLSQPILTGFLNGIALVIIAGQIEALFGYSGDAVEFFPKLAEFANNVDQAHSPTLVLGLGLLALLVMIRFLSPKLPSALMVVILGIVLVSVLDLESRGIAVLGNVPAGLPSMHLGMPTMTEFISIMTDGAAIALLSFISGVLTAKSFARRNRYDVDANQELIGFGASNIIAGLAQGFPVTGADSRTAVNNAMGGKSQVAGLVAAAAMLLVLFFLTDPLAFVPKAALSAVIIVSAIGLFDHKALAELYVTNRLELGISLVAMLGVLILGVLPGVGLAIGLSLAWLLYVVSRPPDAILGRVPGLKGWYSLKDNPEAHAKPGILVFQFNANIVFFNADRFKARVLDAVAASQTPVEWVVLDASPVNYIDVTGINKLDELREELALRDVRIVTATVRDHIGRYFDKSWVEKRKERYSSHRFPTINSAVKAFRESKRHKLVRPAEES